MIFVFAGWKSCNGMRGAQSIIGSADTMEESAVGVAEWAKSEQATWFELLKNAHPDSAPSYCHDMVYKHPLFWYQFAELRGDEMVIIREGEL